MAYACKNALTGCKIQRNVKEISEGVDVAADARRGRGQAAARTRRRAFLFASRRRPCMMLNHADDVTSRGCCIIVSPRRSAPSTI